MFLGLAGCKGKGDSAPPAPSPPAAQKVAPASKGALPVQKQVSTAQLGPNTQLVIDVSSKKDPFKPFVIEQKTAKPVKRKASGDNLPIQNYEVMQFRVAGIIVGLKENRAQIIDPVGKAYIVREGMLIGSNDGKIVKISPSGIDVLEQYRDDSGKLIRRTLKLTLPKKG